jgi:NADPH2:quinone reductase
VLVRITVSSINPSDIKNRGGWGGYKDMPIPRIVPHNAGAGVIEAVGPGISLSCLNERVWLYEAQRDGRASGTTAELVVARNAVPPVGLSQLRALDLALVYPP